MNLADEIVKNLGGLENILSINSCITRLRITLKDSNLAANDKVWRALDAKGVIRINNDIQLFYGTQSDTYRKQILERYPL